MSLRELILDSCAAARWPQMRTAERIAGRWRRLSLAPDAFARLLAVEECAADLVMVLRGLQLSDAPAAPLRAVLTARATDDTAQMLGARFQLLALREAFQSKGVRITLLKGAAFLHAGLRPHRTCSDLDVLIDRADVSVACDVMRELGYQSAPESAAPTHHHLPPFLQQGCLPVELHLSALNREAQGTGLPWRTRDAGGGARVLQPTDWWWHTLAHEARHAHTAGRVRGALDLAELSARYSPDIDWQEIAVRMADWPDPFGPVLLSVLRLGEVFPPAIGRFAHTRARLQETIAGLGREAAARRAASDGAFAQAVDRLGSLLAGTPEAHLTGASARRRLPRAVRDVARVASVILGRDVPPDASEPGAPETGGDGAQAVS